MAAAGVPAAVDDDYATVYLTQLTVAAPGVLGNDDSQGGGAMTAAIVTTGFRIEGGLAPGESLGVVRVGAVRSVTLTLPDGSFYVRVRTEANGVVGAPSDEAVVRVGVPMPPSPPAGLLGAGAGDTLTLAWKNTYIGGAPTGVTLQVAGPVNAAVPLRLTDTFSFAGVPRGTYTFTVIATNAGGTSTASNPVTLDFPLSRSQAPQTVANFVAYNEDGTVVATWDPPASGAAPATYVVNVTGTHAGSIPTQQTGLRGPVPPGTYNLSVVPTNPCGTGAVSPHLTVVVPSHGSPWCGPGGRLGASCRIRPAISFTTLTPSAAT